MEQVPVIDLAPLTGRMPTPRRSPAHRVVNRSGQERYSVPYVAIPDFDAVVTCLPTCQSPDNPPKYEPLHVGQSSRKKFSGDYIA